MSEKCMLFRLIGDFLSGLFTGSLLDFQVWFMVCTDFFKRLFYDTSPVFIAGMLLVFIVTF